MLRFEALNDRQRRMLLDGTLTIDVLAARFGVCRRSITRYRRQLEATQAQQAEPAKENT